MTDSVLDKLPSKVFYKELTGDRSDISDGKYSIVCESITTDSPKQGKINEICKKLRQNIYYLENVRKDDSSIFDKHCYDLNYWLYDELSKEPDESNTKNIYPFFEKIQVKWKNIKREEQPQNSGKICEPKSEPFKTGLFKCIKELLDYFENFQTFKTEMETEQTEMKKKEPNKYCEYIKKCVPLYFTFKQLCKLIKNEICTKYLQNNDSYDPTQLLSKLSCVEGGKYEVKLDDGLVKEMITTYQSNFGNLLTGFGNILPGFGSIIPGLGSIMPGLSSIIPGLGNLFTGSLQGMFTNSIYNLMQKGFAESTIKPLFNRITSYAGIFYTENFQKYGLPSLFGLGCLTIFFILYKCCGCSPCCCIPKKKKKRRKHISDLDTSELMSTSIGFSAPMMPINPYALRYQPM